MRKEIHNGHRQAQLRNLALLNHSKHPNIIELLASYSHRDKHNLIFPLADDGSLYELFKNDRQDNKLKSDAELLVAAAGLSSAIEHVHRSRGIHGDIRPRQILVTENTLVLDGFENAIFDKSSDSPVRAFEHGYGDYRPPECEDIDSESFTRYLIRQSSDIWAFGCILAELLTYIVDGPDGIGEFRKTRTFYLGPYGFCLFHCGPHKPNIAVKMWLLHLKHSHTQTHKKLLDLIFEMLSVDEKNRPKARMVTETLRHVSLCELVESAIDRFEHVRTKTPINVFTERLNFESWVYAVGILEKGDLAKIDLEVSASHVSGFKSMVEKLGFKSMVEKLYKLLGLLELLATSPQDRAGTHLCQLSEINNDLRKTLDRRLEERFERCIRDPLLRDRCGVQFHQRQDVMSESLALLNQPRWTTPPSMNGDNVTLVDPSVSSLQFPPLSSEITLLDVDSSARTTETYVVPGYRISAENTEVDSDDIESIASKYGASQADTDTSMLAYHYTATEVIVKALLGDDELSNLYDRAVSQVGQDRFLRNNRRLLQWLSRDLQISDLLPSQLTAIRFLAKQRGSRLVSAAICHELFAPETSLQSRLDPAGAEKMMLDRFLHDMDDAIQHKSVEHTLADPLQVERVPACGGDSDTTSDTDPDLDRETNDSPELGTLEATVDFIVTGEPFQIYKQRLREWLKPPSQSVQIERKITAVGFGSDQQLLTGESSMQIFFKKN